MSVTVTTFTERRFAVPEHSNLFQHVVGLSIAGDATGGYGQCQALLTGIAPGEQVWHDRTLFTTSYDPIANIVRLYTPMNSWSNNPSYAFGIQLGCAGPQTQPAMPPPWAAWDIQAATLPGGGGNYATYTPARPLYLSTIAAAKPEIDLVIDANPGAGNGINVYLYLLVAAATAATANAGLPHIPSIAELIRSRSR